VDGSGPTRGPAASLTTKRLADERGLNGPNKPHNICFPGFLFNLQPTRWARRFFARYHRRAQRDDLGKRDSAITGNFRWEKWMETSIGVNGQFWPRGAELPARWFPRRGPNPPLQVFFPESGGAKPAGPQATWACGPSHQPPSGPKGVTFFLGFGIPAGGAHNLPRLQVLRQS